MTIEEIAKLLCYSAYHVYSLSMTVEGEAAKKMRARMMTPQVGDMVMEVSSLGRCDCYTQVVGKLLEIQENPLFHYPEDDNLGKTTNKKYIIEALDGERVEWENCRFVVIPQNFYNIEP